MAHEEFESELDLDNPGKQVFDETGLPKGQDTDVEIDIIDDTPAEDRGRKPLPKEVVEQLEEEDPEVEQYSAKVKQRIDQMKKAWHDERRAKEAAIRERDEAARIAQMAYRERQEYLQQLKQGENWALDQAKQRAALQLESAKRAYREAYEAGDADKLVESQHALNMASMEFQQVNGLQPRYAHVESLQQQKPVVQQQQPDQPFRPPEPDSRAKEWGAKNTWFGKDEEMTSFALGVHQKLIKEGIAPSTDEYYERIDARMKSVFPDKFGTQKRQPSTVVAPVGRSPKGKKVVLTQTQVAMARRLGVTPEEYAKELIKLQKEN